MSTLYVRDTYSPENLTQADNSQNPKVKCWFWVSIKINVKKGQIIDFSKISFNFELFDYIQKKREYNKPIKCNKNHKYIHNISRPL